MLRNCGTCSSDEVVQLYVSDLEASCRVPQLDLRGFQRIHLDPGQATRVTFTLTPKDLSLIDETGARLLEPGKFRVSVGGSQPDARSIELTGQAPLAIDFEVVGELMRLAY